MLILSLSLSLWFFTLFVSSSLHELFIIGVFTFFTVASFMFSFGIGWKKGMQEKDMVGNDSMDNWKKGM